MLIHQNIYLSKIIKKINEDEYFITTLPDGSKYYEIPKREFNTFINNLEILN